MNRTALHGANLQGGGSPVIVFGHGLGGGQDHWAAVVERLKGRATCVTFALAGSSGADPALFSPDRHASVLGYADDLAMLCAEMGIRGAVFVGHSMSGMAGALASAADPGLFSRLVLLNASACYHDDPTTGYAGGFSPDQIEGILGALAGNYADWSAGFAALVMGNGERPELASAFAKSLGALDPRKALVAFRAAFSSDFREVMPRVQVPVLLLQNPADPAVPMSAARWLAGALPQARLEVLPVEGHFPHLVAPEKVVAALEAFALGEP